MKGNLVWLIVLVTLTALGSGLLAARQRLPESRPTPSPIPETGLRWEERDETGVYSFELTRTPEGANYTARLSRVSREEPNPTRTGQLGRLQTEALLRQLAELGPLEPGEAPQKYRPATAQLTLLEEPGRESSSRGYLQANPAHAAVAEHSVIGAERARLLGGGHP